MAYLLTNLNNWFTVHQPSQTMKIRKHEIEFTLTFTIKQPPYPAQSINHIYLPKHNLNRLVNASTKMAGYKKSYRAHQAGHP